MTRDEITHLIRQSSWPSNLDQVIAKAMKAAEASTIFVIHSKNKDDGPDLDSNHYLRGFSRRMQRHDGIANEIEGFSESLFNFEKHQGPLKLIVIELDRSAQVSFWISGESEIIGCMIAKQNQIP